MNFCNFRNKWHAFGIIQIAELRVFKLLQEVNAFAY